MGDDLAASNVNRSYSLAATSIAIFTFLLFFLYPRFVSGEIGFRDPPLSQDPVRAEESWWRRSTSGLKYWMR